MPSKHASHKKLGLQLRSLPVPRSTLSEGPPSTHAGPATPASEIQSQGPVSGLESSCKANVAANLGNRRAKWRLAELPEPRFGENRRVGHLGGSGFGSSRSQAGRHVQGRYTSHTSLK